MFMQLLSSWFRALRNDVLERNSLISLFLRIDTTFPASDRLEDFPEVTYLLGVKECGQKVEALSEKKRCHQ